MSNKNSIIKHMKACLWSVFGLFFVFVVVVEMNEKGMLPDQKREESSINFEVKKIIKPKLKPKPKERKKRVKPHRNASRPNIGSNLSGIDTGLESFMSDDIGVDDSLLGDVGKDVVMSEGSVDKAPSPLQRGAIEYPKKAKKMGIKGYVLLNLLINKNGDVVKVKVLESDPAGVFDAVATDGVKSWKFSPGEYKGKAVKVWAKQKIRFDFQ